MLSKRFYLLLLLFLSPLTASEKLQRLIMPLEVHLNEATYEKGSLSTESGGIVEGEGLRIQAEKISIVWEGEEKEITAEGKLIFEYKDHLFVGERLHYSFTQKQGTLTCGRGGMGPWAFSGERIDFSPEGRMSITKGRITTCDKATDPPLWFFQAEHLFINSCGDLLGRRGGLFFGPLPPLPLPYFSTNLNSLCDSPLSSSFRIGGPTGSQAGLRYRILSKGPWRAYLRADYLLAHGPAGGAEINYVPCEEAKGRMRFYCAHDLSVSNPRDRFRYRVAGKSRFPLQGGWKGSCCLDWLSDPEMASDFMIRDWTLHTARTSQLDLERCWPRHRIDVAARARVNSFQTVDQLLPRIRWSHLTRPVGTTKILAEGAYSLAYHNYVFAPETKEAGQVALRAEGRESFYRALPLSSGVFTPRLDLLAVAYSKNKKGDPQRLLQAIATLDFHVRLARTYGPSYKHTLKPYCTGTFASQPTSFNHFIFSIDDGFAPLRTLRFGLQQALYHKRAGQRVCSFVDLDLFAIAFLRTPTIIGTIPRIYANLQLRPLPTLAINWRAGWNCAHSQPDHSYLWVRWTLNEDVAANVGIRYRSRYAYLKANNANFVLDTDLPETQLLKKPLSARAFTLLTHFFFRPHPLWAVEFESHHGWGRRFGTATKVSPVRAPSYNEYKISLHLRLPCHWNFRCYLERRESGWSGGFRFKLGPNLPPKP